MVYKRAYKRRPFISSNRSYPPIVHILQPPNPQRSRPRFAKG
ncbi:hypothetical protein COLSTE_02481 [Collinsella stercoris DSM 13279]|uniref:Uncharacterized protein n=1 Tax=Collinsella stercoris DSM 13279 TaxID=445975 RepID=B6GEE1_9ACTN|nr:hypothetical protein COLSTE_02481 [Collinsella stercoris DSM 13279]